jgi:hypothetical protein
MGPQELVSPSLHRETQTGPVPETLFSSYLQIQTMDEAHKPRDSECYHHVQCSSVYGGGISCVSATVGLQETASAV